MYRVKLGKDVEGVLESNESESIGRIVYQLAEEPRPSGSLDVGDGDYRLLTKEWMLFYKIDDSKKLIRVVKLERVPETAKRPKLTREEAIRIVQEGIGKRLDLPSGSEYVDAVRHIWRGLLPRDRRSP